MELYRYLAVATVVFIIHILIITAAGERHPHIIFIMTEGLGWNDISLTNPFVKTPALQRLADTGLVLNQSYGLPSAAGSQYAAMTGRYPFRDGIQYVEGNELCLPEHQVLLPQLLKEQGFQTHMVGRWRLKQCSNDPASIQQGFNTIHGINEDLHTIDGSQCNMHKRNYNETNRNNQSSSVNDMLVRRALDVLGSHDAGSPLFLFLSLIPLHHSMQIPESFLQMYEDIQNNVRQRHLGAVSYMDDIIDRLMTTLRKRDLYRNAIIVFTSMTGDNPGSGASSFPLRGTGRSLYEAGVRTFTVVSGGRIKTKGCVHDGIFHMTDWFSTLLHVTKGKSESDTDGVNQWDMLVSGRDSNRHQMALNLDTFVTDFHRPVTGFAAFRYGDYKLILGPSGLMADSFGWPIKCVPPPEVCQQEIAPEISQLCKGSPSGLSEKKSHKQDYYKAIRRGVHWEVMLHNIEADPGESTNLVEDLPDLASLLLEKIQEYYHQEAPPILYKNKDLNLEAIFEGKMPKERILLKNFETTLRNIKSRKASQLTCTFTLSKLLALILDDSELSVGVGCCAAILFLIILIIKYCAIRRDENPVQVPDVNNNPDPSREHPPYTSQDSSGSWCMLPIGRKDKADVLGNRVSSKVKETLKSLTKRREKRGKGVKRTNSLFINGEQPSPQCCVIS